MDLHKRSSKIRENFVSNQKLNIIKWLWWKDGPSEKVFTCQKLSPSPEI